MYEMYQVLSMVSYSFINQMVPPVSARFCYKKLETPSLPMSPKKLFVELLAMSLIIYSVLI